MANAGKYYMVVIRNEKVEGSIPFSGTNQINDLGHLARVAFFFDLTPI